MQKKTIPYSTYVPYINQKLKGKQKTINDFTFVPNYYLFRFSSNFVFFQCLEQEKHVLRRKLSEAESERDLRVQELESDYNDLKSKLMSQVIKHLIFIYCETK